MAMAVAMAAVTVAATGDPVSILVIPRTVPPMDTGATTAIDHHMDTVVVIAGATVAVDAEVGRTGKSLADLVDSL